VVVGDLIGSGVSQEQAIVGDTPNLEARLQGVAEPNSVVIAESTRRLVGSLFEFEDLGAKDLEGIAGAVRAWTALRPSSVESRFDALHAGDLTGLVGRGEELELLLRRSNKRNAHSLTRRRPCGLGESLRCAHHGLQHLKAREIIPAPRLAIERELAIVAEPGALILRQRLRDRFAAGAPRQGLPERKDVQQGVVEATAGHWTRYVSGIADERHVPRNEPRRYILGDRSAEATSRAQTHLDRAPPRIRPEFPRAILKGSARSAGMADGTIEWRTFPPSTAPVFRSNSS
jgi:hypothetical protein